MVLPCDLFNYLYVFGDQAVRDLQLFGLLSLNGMNQHPVEESSLAILRFFDLTSRAICLTHAAV